MRTIAVAVLTCVAADLATASPVDFKDWTATFVSGVYEFSNTSSAGTITSQNVSSGFVPAAFNIKLPSAISTKTFPTEFQINGTTGLNTPIDFFFSAGYGWGSGGQLVIGNIHNYFQYTVSAWDFNNQPIDVNSWITPSGLLAEYSSAAPGSLGYFSTSSTSRAAADADGTLNPLGFSTNFSVLDGLASANGGQGGVLVLGGLKNVGMIELTLTSSSLGPNAQSVDFMIFNVGTPVSEPSTAALTGIAALALAWAGRRRTDASNGSQPIAGGPPACAA